MRPNLTAREQRITGLLLDMQEHSRNEITAKCGPVNVSSAMEGLCRKTGLQIPCTRKPIRDRDGKTARPGFWRFTEADAEKVKAWEAQL